MGAMQQRLFAAVGYLDRFLRAHWQDFWQRVVEPIRRFFRFFRELRDQGMRRTLAFADPVAERRYWDVGAARSRNRSRFAFLVAVFLTSCYWYLYNQAFHEVPDPENWLWGGMTAGVAVLFLLSFGTFPGATARYIRTAILLSAGVGWCWLIIAAGDPHVGPMLEWKDKIARVSFLLSPCIMSIIYAFYYAGLPFRFAVFAAGGIALATALGAVRTLDVSWAALIVIVAAWGAYVLTAADAFARELVSRRSFLARRLERWRRVAQQESLEALQHFLTHDVSFEPLRNSFGQLRKAMGRDSVHYAATADIILQIRELERLVARAARATEDDARFAGSVAERFDLAAELARVVDDENYEEKVPIFLDARGIANLKLVADRQIIRLALSNLLRNAVRHATENTPVQVTAAIDERDAIRISVTNTGRPVQIEATKMTRFFTTNADPSSGHRGLGLAFVKGVAERHGGEAGIADRPDANGVVAWFTIARQTPP